MKEQKNPESRPSGQEEEREKREAHQKPPFMNECIGEVEEFIRVSVLWKGEVGNKQKIPLLAPQSLSPRYSGTPCTVRPSQHGVIHPPLLRLHCKCFPFLCLYVCFLFSEFLSLCLLRRCPGFSVFFFLEWYRWQGSEL